MNNDRFLKTIRLYEENPEQFDSGENVLPSPQTIQKAKELLTTPLTGDIQGFEIVCLYFGNDGSAGIGLYKDGIVGELVVWNDDGLVECFIFGDRGMISQRFAYPQENPSLPK